MHGLEILRLFSGCCHVATRQIWREIERAIEGLLPRGNIAAGKCEKKGSEYAMAKGNRGFGSSLTEGLDDDIEVGSPAPSESIMASRSQSLGKDCGRQSRDRSDRVGRPGSLPSMAAP
jgi:hypothetical protein